jgi:hypothetical protein
VILHSSRLAVEIADLGTTYQGTRFDWTGLITQVTLDGRHTFCQPESLVKGRGTGGIGLCNEFGVFYPVGYHDAEPGETFPKIGVGLLTRPTLDHHDFAINYEMKPFPVRVKQSDSRVVYEMDPLPCRGYETRLRKTVQLSESGIDIFYELKNVGTKAIHTHEYNHNFVSIDGSPSGPAYLLRLAKGIAFAPDEFSPLLTHSDGDVRWKSNVVENFLSPAPGAFKVTGPAWELIHEPSGVGLRETVDFPIAHFGLWCAPHLIAPEVFITIDLSPGELQTWTRHYDFFAPRLSGRAPSSAGTFAATPCLSASGREN